MNKVFRATISVEDGRSAFRATTLLAARIRDGECLGGELVKGLCAAETPLVDRWLTDEEVEGVRATFWKLSTEAPRPDCFLADPCVIDVFTWDAEWLTDDPCDGPRISGPISGDHRRLGKPTERSPRLLGVQLFTAISLRLLPTPRRCL